MAYTRRLQKIGQSLFVSLPKTWIKRMQLDKGDSIMLVEQPDDSVVIHPGIKTDSLKEIILRIDIEESTRSLRRKITGAYVDGYDVIRLEAEEKFTNEQQDTIRKTTEALFGLEIIEVTSNSITVQCLLAKILPIESTIQRIHSITKSMFSETISALKERNPKEVQGVTKRTQDVKRLSLVMHRLLRSLILFPVERTPEMKAIDSVDFLRVIDKITEVSGSVTKIAESVAMRAASFPDSVLDQLLAICAKTLELYDLSIRSLMSKDVSLANNVLDEELDPDFEDLWDILLREIVLMPEASGPILSHVPRILDHLEQIHRYTLEIAEAAIDRAEELT